MEWKWTKSEPYERSKRQYKNSNKTINTPKNNENCPIDFEKIIKEQENTAYSSSLNYDENTWDILNQTVAKNGFQISNKREEIDSKMADRSLVQQTNINPFLEQNNYVDDVFIRDKFLKPINTTIDTTSDNVHNNENINVNEKLNEKQ